MYCGNEKFFTENSIEIDDDIKTRLEQLRMQGKASVLVADGAKCVGIIALSAVLRPEAEKMVHKLHEMKTEVVLLTGDNKKLQIILLNRWEYTMFMQNYYQNRR